MWQHVDRAALTEGSCQLHCKQLSQGRAAKFAHARCLPEIAVTELLAASRWESISSQMKYHRGSVRKLKFFTKKITACIERATVLRAKNNT